MNEEEHHRALLEAGRAAPDSIVCTIEETGFVVIADRVSPARCRELRSAYDTSVTGAVPRDMASRNCTRVHDFVNRGSTFDELWLDPLLLALCARVLRRPFKLSSFHARAVNPGCDAQRLHVDREREEGQTTLLSFIWMIDDFRPDNGATRIVPGSHRQQSALEPVLAVGTAGSLLVYDGAIMHGYSANASANLRRSLQGAFIWRSREQGIDQRARLLPATAARLDHRAKYLLDVL